MTILETKLKIDSWQEEPYREADGQKWTRAEVILSGTDPLRSGAFEALMHYLADGTGTSVLLMRLDGVLDGHSGSVVLAGRGTFDGETTRVSSTVVPGSGTGGLVTIAGSAESASTRDDYPWMPLTLRYELA